MITEKGVGFFPVALGIAGLLICQNYLLFNKVVCVCFFCVRVCVHVRLCVHVRVCVCMSVCVHFRECIFISFEMMRCVCMCRYMWECVCVCVCVCMYL